MKIVFKGGYVFEVSLVDAIVSFGEKKVVVNWINGDKTFEPFDSVGNAWTIPFELIEDVKL